MADALQAREEVLTEVLEIMAEKQSPCIHQHSVVVCIMVLSSVGKTEARMTARY